MSFTDLLRVLRFSQQFDITIAVLAIQILLLVCRLMYKSNVKARSTVASSESSLVQEFVRSCARLKLSPLLQPKELEYWQSLLHASSKR